MLFVIYMEHLEI